MYGRCWAWCIESLDTLRVVLDSDDVRARRAGVEGDGCHAIRCANVRIDLRAVRRVYKAACCLAEEVAVEVASRNCLVDREGVTSGDRGHFHPIEEDTRGDCAHLIVLDRVLKLTERHCST